MDYSKNYLQISGLADRLRESATQKTRGGFAERIRELEDIREDFTVTQANYFKDIQDMFAETRAAQESLAMKEPEAFVGEITEDTVRPQPKPSRKNDLSEPAEGYVSPGYPEGLSQKNIEGIVRAEARLRNMDPDVAVAIFRSEGAGSYQSQVSRSGKGALGGKEASFGPFQLFIGGGLGNAYQKATGRDLTRDNTVDGITKQIQFSLDEAAKSGWGAWYGRKTAGVGVREGVENAKPIYNWKEQ